MAAYDTSPYDSAKRFDDVDKGILVRQSGIRENYIDRGRDHLETKRRNECTLCIRSVLG